MESIKQFMKNPSNIKIYKKGSWKLIKKGAWPHFYWYNKRENKFYHFEAIYEDEPFVYQLWFRGFINEFNYGGKKNESENKKFNK